MKDQNFDKTIETETIHVDFGTVGVGNTVVRTIKIINQSHIEQSYKVQKDPITNPLDYVFNLKEYFWTLQSGCKHVCNISYQPVVAFSKNTDYFTITDNDENYCYKIIVQGISIGPDVWISATRLLFYTSREKNTAKKRIKITNKSQVPAIFLFDLDKKQCPFKLSLTHGTIKPSSFINVNIYFLPSAPGVHSYYLPCLILNQKPIIIELYAYFGSVYSNENQFYEEILIHFRPKLEGFESYMGDVSNIQRGNPPLISLTKSYIDFGEAPVGLENSTRRIPQTVCFHNHSNSNILVIWEDVISGAFKIKPSGAQVDSKKSIIFEIRFDPLEEKSLYYQEVLLKAFKKHERVSPFCQSIPIQSTIPWVKPLRMIGHSFPVGTKEWIPRYQLPQTVTMPACVPEVPTYTTFLIRKLESEMPLMFRFIPPKISNFTVKPMLGIIYNDYQIVTIELFPESKDEHLYFESWTVQFNDYHKSKIHIDFKGYAEYPNLIFQSENLVYFDPTFPGCSQSQQVSIRNITRHCIRYSIPHKPKELKIQYSNDIIHPNEILSHKWFFCPEISGNYNFTVDCKLIALENKNEIELQTPSNSVKIFVSGIGETGTLIALPHELNFGELAFRNSKTLSFYLFNFSRVAIHFKLYSKHRNWPIGLPERDLKFSPTIGTILPCQNEKIDVTITPQEPGFYELFIQYFVRSDCNPDSPILKDEPKIICRLNCMSVVPTLNVEDLLYYGMGHNISKVYLWETMQINRLNKILNNMSPNSNQNSFMGFPAFKIHEQPFCIELLITNPTMVPVSWLIKRVQLCSCKKSFKSKSFSLQNATYDCVHREVCNISPKSGTLKPRKKTRLSIKLRYSSLGITELQWDLIFEEDRRLTLKTKVRCLSKEDEEIILFQEPPLRLDQVYLGDLNPIHQMCWMYNNIERELSYNLDIEALRKINEKFGAEIFSCLNPSGSVKALSNYPLIFKYHPIQFQEYRITIPIKLGKRETELTLHGECSNNPKIKFVERIPPCQDTFFIPEVPVYYNYDIITISPMPTNSSVTRIIIVHNNLNQDVLEFSWENYELPEIIEAKIHPSEGKIQPLSMQIFLLTVNTGSRSCKITIYINCKFINFNQRCLYEKEILTQLDKLKESENEFIVTEKGVEYPKKKSSNLGNLKPPEPFFKALTIRACVFSLEDWNLKTTLKERLKFIPTEQSNLHRSEKKTPTTEEILNICTSILECMIWDISNSRISEYYE